MDCVCLWVWLLMFSVFVHLQTWNFGMLSENRREPLRLLRLECSLKRNDHVSESLLTHIWVGNFVIFSWNFTLILFIKSSLDRLLDSLYLFNYVCRKQSKMKKPSQPINQSQAFGTVTCSTVIHFNYIALICVFQELKLFWLKKINLSEVFFLQCTCAVLKPGSFTNIDTNDDEIYVLMSLFVKLSFFKLCVC